jgi:hypothetical protein
VKQFSNNEIAFLRETLKACFTEFEELVLEKEWYVTEVLDRIESSLEILNSGS